MKRLILLLLLTGCAADLTTIEGINSYVNGFKYVPDAINYGRDYMATPEEFFENGGDCEDYANAKKHLLIEAGLGKNIMFKPVNDNHVVLIVDGMVLDNRTGHILTVEEAKKYYKF